MSKPLTDFSLNDFCLKGKVAMITGANQGLGVAYAIALAKAGADIFIHFTDEIAEIKKTIEGIGRKVGFLQGDLTDDAYRKVCKGLPGYVWENRYSDKQCREQLYRTSLIFLMKVEAGY